MKKINYSALCAALALCLSGCVFINFSDFNTVRGKGVPEKFEFKVGEYNRITVDGYCEVRYYSASSDAVTLEIQPNLLEHYAIEVIGGELVVSNKKRLGLNTTVTPVLTVSTPVLTRLNIDGAGVFLTYDKITAESFDLILGGAGRGRVEMDVKSLSVDMSGAGSFDLYGRADTADLTMSGAGALNASLLQTRETKVSFSGIGDLKIHCTENLRIIADGLGSVEYSGSPRLDLSNSGLVSVKKIN